MLLSIIIATKNPGLDIYPTLKSLTTLNNPQVEIIIKDNSINNELENINKLFAFKNFKYIHSEDSGIYDAMNQAILYATGEFIYFLNAGDQYIDCGVIEILENTPENIGYLYGNVINIYPKVRLVCYTRFMNKYTLYLKNICHQALIYRKEVFEKVGVYDIHLKIDADFLHMIKMSKHFKGQKIKNFICVYKGNGFSCTHKVVQNEINYLQQKLKENFNMLELSLLKVVQNMSYCILLFKSIQRKWYG